jgi:sugar/nucleoside kinase (ribokinase family)
MTRESPDVVHVGSASRDLTDDEPRGWRLGGGAPYSALATARLGLRTGALIGVDALASTATEFELLRDAGVDLEIVPLAESPAFVNRETPEGRIQTCVAAGQPLRVSWLPARWRDVRTWSLVPIAGEVEEGWASAMPIGAFVSLGWQGLLRHLEVGREVLRTRPDRSRLVRRADLVGVSRNDLATGTRAEDLLGLLHPGARLVVTDGLDGGRMLRRSDGGRVTAQQYWAIAADRDMDPTGAGDVFLAALLASRTEPPTTPSGADDEPPVDLPFAAAAASLVVEAPGLHGVPGRLAVVARLART